MKKKISIMLLFIFLCSFVFPPLALSEEKIWVDLATSVDENGTPITSRQYGYYVEVPDLGRVFVVCDPSTGKETEEAYIPNATIGETEMLTGYEYRSGLDWDNHKIVYPPNMSFIMPNVVTSTTYDWDYHFENLDAPLRTIGENQFRWPGSGNALITGNNPDDWMIVAVVTNPNPFPATIGSSGFIAGWYNSGEQLTHSSVDSFGPNETKYILVNRGRKADLLARELFPTYSSVNFCNTQIQNITSPDYADDLRTESQVGLFYPFAEWDGTNARIVPSFPMRLAYRFSAYGYDTWRDIFGGYVTGTAVHDPLTNEWNVEANYYGSTKQSPQAKKLLTDLFETWGYKIPLVSMWTKDTVWFDGKTGKRIIFYNSNDRGNINIGFDYLSPYPVYYPQNMGLFDRAGAWNYEARGPFNSSDDLTSGVVVQYNGLRTVEVNYSETNRGRLPTGTYIEYSSTDPQYYDPKGWMRYFPVVKSEPIFLEKYSFIETEGNAGYLVKNISPGVRTWVAIESRPTLNVVTEPIEIDAYCGTLKWSSADNRYHYYWDHYQWTPENGMEHLGGQINDALPLSDQNMDNWNVEICYKQKIEGQNPASFKAQWGAPNFNLNMYWPNTLKVKEKLMGLASTKMVYNYYTGLYDLVVAVDSINLDEAAPAVTNAVLLPKETKDLTGYHQKTASIDFKAYYAEREKVLNKLSNEIIPLIAQKDEAAFGQNLNFTFESLPDDPVQIVSGAQKTLIHKRYGYDRKYDYYGFKDWSQKTIGSPYAQETALSYFSPNNATQGIVSRPGDICFSAMSRFMPVSQQWRMRTESGYSPPDYPE